MEGQPTIAGQLTFRRAVSKRLVFYDLLIPASGPGSDSAWVEVVVKEGNFGSIQEVKDLRDRLKLGDLVSVEGRWEGPHTLQAAAVTLQQAWRDSHPLVSFTPQPSPLHGKREAPGAQHGVEQVSSSQQPATRGATRQGGAESRGSDQKQTSAALRTSPAAAVAAAATAAATAMRPAQSVEGPVPAPEAAPATAAAAARAAAERLAVCKFWVNTGRCAKGDACPHAHLQSGMLQQRWLNQMRAERQALSSAQGFAHSGSAAAKARRAQVFAAWLVEAFGREALNAGAGVLDVAGGAGGMTFELSFVHGVRCTLVDPRPLKLNKQQHRLLQQAGRGAAICTLTAEQLEEQQAQQAQQRQQQAQQEGEAEGLGGEAGLQAAGEAAGPGPGGPGPLQLHQVQALFGPELWRGAGWRRRFRFGFSLVLGLHPDQATDPILEYALEAGAPFAIVPCCVFARLFPGRRLWGPPGGGATDSSSGSGVEEGAFAGGVPVESYPQLVEYLAQRSGAERAVLGFEGANVVVYRTRPAEARTEKKKH